MFYIKCDNYSRAETIQGRKLFAEIRYEIIVRSSASSFGHSDPDPGSVIAVQCTAQPNKSD